MLNIKIYTKTSKNNVNKTRSLLQTTGGKDEPNIGFYTKIVTGITTRNSERKHTYYDNINQFNLKYIFKMNTIVKWNVHFVMDDLDDNECNGCLDAFNISPAYFMVTWSWCEINVDSPILSFIFTLDQSLGLGNISFAKVM